MCNANECGVKTVERGFTLIEIMIVIVIVAILASVALPAYTEHIRRSHLQEAYTNLADYRAKMEQYFQDNKNYGATGGTVCATAATAGSWNTFVPGSAKYFNFACVTNNAGMGYVVTANGVDGDVVHGYSYTIDEAGTQRTVSIKGIAENIPCWVSSTSATCH